MLWKAGFAGIIERPELTSKCDGRVPAAAAAILRHRRRGIATPGRAGVTGAAANRGQPADSGTSASRDAPLPISASVSIRHDPPASTSAGRNRDLYAILWLSGTQ
jgi:hypothetical protein